MPVAPPVLVDTAPSLTPPRFGLLSAGELVDWNDPHLHNGVEFVPNASGAAAVEGSYTDPYVTPTLDTEVPTVVSGPIPVVAGYNLPTTALTADEAAARARARLSAGEVAAVEKHLWEDADHPLAGGAVPLATDAVSLVQAIGMIEDYFGARYGGTPVIHAPRQLGAYAAAEDVTVREGQKMTTPLGSVWSFGNYPGTLDGSGVWLIATGQVQIRRSDITVHGADHATSLNRTSNRVRVSAHRTYIVTWDGIAAAVPIDVDFAGPTTTYPGSTVFPGLTYPQGA